MKKINTFKIVLTSIFLSIMILMSLFPWLGFVPLGPIKATTMHIPVIIASLILGPLAGSFLGFSFGCISLINATINPTPLSFLFSPFIPVLGSNHGSISSLIITFIPRILIGVVPYFVYKYLKEKVGKNSALVLSGISGSMVNTVLVLNLIYFLFQESYAKSVGIAENVVYKAILVIIFTNGVPEAILAGAITMLLCRVISNNHLYDSKFINKL